MIEKPDRISVLQVAVIVGRVEAVRLLLDAVKFTMVLLFCYYEE